MTTLSSPIFPTTFLSWFEWSGTPPGRGALLYFAAYMCLGMTLSQFGPVIIDLAATTGGSIRDTGLCLLARSFAYLIGAACGPLFDRVPGHPILAFAMVMCGLGTALIPSATSTAGLAIIVMLQGVAMGLLDTGCNLSILWWFGKDAGPYMQALHCLFGVGASLGPLLLRLVESSNGALDYVVVSGGGKHTDGITTYAPAFYMTSVACFALSILFCFAQSPSSRSSDPETEVTASGSGSVAKLDIATTTTTTSTTSSVEGVSVGILSATNNSVATTPEQLRRLQLDKWITVIIAAILLGIYVGAETGYGAFLTAYNVIELGSTEARGQWLASLFWFSITAGRFASIWLSVALTPGTFMRASMGLSAFAALVLLQAGKNEGGLWVVTVIFGVAMAPVFPTCLSLVESYFPVLGKYATILMIGSASGEMIIPAIISLTAFNGAAEEADNNINVEAPNGSIANPRALLNIIAVCSVLNFLVLLLLQYQGAKVAVVAAQQQLGNQQQQQQLTLASQVVEPYTNSQEILEVEAVSSSVSDPSSNHALTPAGLV